MSNIIIVFKNGEEENVALFSDMNVVLSSAKMFLDNAQSLSLEKIEEITEEESFIKKVLITSADAPGKQCAVYTDIVVDDFSIE